MKSRSACMFIVWPMLVALIFISIVHSGQIGRLMNNGNHGVTTLVVERIVTQAEIPITETVTGTVYIVDSDEAWIRSKNKGELTVSSRKDGKIQVLLPHGGEIAFWETDWFLYDKPMKKVVRLVPGKSNDKFQEAGEPILVIPGNLKEIEAWKRPFEDDYMAGLPSRGLLVGSYQAKTPTEVYVGTSEVFDTSDDDTEDTGTYTFDDDSVFLDDDTEAEDSDDDSNRQELDSAPCDEGEEWDAGDDDGAPCDDDDNDGTEEEYLDHTVFGPLDPTSLPWLQPTCTPPDYYDEYGKGVYILGEKGRWIVPCEDTTIFREEDQEVFNL